MAYRCLYIRKSEKIRLKENSLMIYRSEGEQPIAVPLSDISMIYLEDNRTTISTNLISEFAKNYVGLICSDESFKPVSITLPLHMHYKQLKVFQTQLELKKPTRNQLWAQIIKGKIYNQQKVIQLTSQDEYALEKMDELMGDVQSNDKTNREAVAAKVFFRALYGRSFTRKASLEDEVNAALNFGYTILSTMTTRILTMYGFNTVLGLHHVSMTNNFNLSFDVVECFRPVVDLYVYRNMNLLCYPLSKTIKKELIDLLVFPIRINGKTYRIEHAIEVMILSLIKCYETNSSDYLLIPEIIDGGDGVVDDIDL